MISGLGIQFLSDYREGSRVRTGSMMHHHFGMSIISFLQLKLLSNIRTLRSNRSALCWIRSFILHFLLSQKKELFGLIWVRVFLEAVGMMHCFSGSS